MSARSLLFVLGGLALGTLMASCTPSSSSSTPSPPDTSATEAAAEPVDDKSAQRQPTDAPPPSDANSRSLSQKLADASVAARAKQALARHQTLRRFEFAPSVVRGHLILRGDVNTREQYREAERVVTSLSDVSAVTNEVTVNGRSVAEGDESSSSDATYHTVQRGDTLTDISRRYGVSVRQLQRLNDLSATLQPGERIRVR